MDITNLTSQITSLRAETQERSITPERVGSLLQQLANLIKSTADSAATQNDIYEITDNAVSNMRTAVAASANGVTVTLTLIELDGEDFAKTITLPIATANAAGLISAADYAAIQSLISGGSSGSGSGMTTEERAVLNNLASRFVRLGTNNGVWVSSHDAELQAARLEYCSNPDIWFLYYYVQGSKYGLIEQHVCDDTCIQILHWDSAVSQRTITFANTDRTAISEVGEWTVIRTLTAAEASQLRNAAATTAASFTAGESSQKKKYKIWLTLRDVSGQVAAEYDVDIPLASSETMGVMSSADKVKLDALPDAATIAAALGRDNMGIHNLGYVGNASAPGETAAAALSIASDPAIKWVLYTYSSNMAIIHQTHNETTTVQDMYFAGNKHSRRTITFTDNTRTAISSVGSWSSVGTDIGVSRTATTATIKLVHPFMENSAGVLTLTIGQANSNYAGLMTKENLRTLNYLDEQFEEMAQTMLDLGNAVSALQDSVAGINNRINSLGDYFVMKPKLYAFADIPKIVIPVKDISSSGCTIASRVVQNIQLNALDENDNSIDVMDCNVTWSFGTNDNIFHVEYEGGKRYVTFYADEDDYWQGNGNGTLTITLTNLNNNTSGSYEIILERSLSQN